MILDMNGCYGKRVEMEKAENEPPIGGDGAPVGFGNRNGVNPLRSIELSCPFSFYIEVGGISPVYVPHDL